MKATMIIGLIFSSSPVISGQDDSTLLISYLDIARPHTSKNEILKMENH